MTANQDAQTSTRADSRTVSVWWLIAAVTVAGAGLFGLVDEPTAGLSLVQIGLLLSGFVAAELLSINLWVRGEAHSKALSEAPLAAGLLLAAPLGLLVADVAAILIVFGLVHRQRGAKLGFNIAQYGAQVAMALTVFGLLAGDGGPMTPRAWVAAIVAAFVAEITSSMLVSAAIYMSLGEVDVRGALRTDLSLLPGVVASGAVGVLAVVLHEVHAGALVMLAVVVFTALGAYRGYGSLLRRHRHLQLLQGYSRDIAEAVARDDVVAVALRGAADLLDAQRAYLVLVVPDRPGHVLRARFADGEVRTGIEPIDPGDPVARVLGTEEAIHLRRSGSGGRGALTPLGLQEMLVAPLRSDGAVVGALAVANEQGDVDAFDRNDLALFVTLCDQTALTLQNGQLLSQLRAEIEERQYRALHDEVTGLGNRAALLEELAERCSLSNPFAVVVVGLAGFSRINEALGYERGDEVLDRLAQRVRQRLRGGDWLGRLSGGEFAVLLDDVPTLDAARSAAAGIVETLAEPIAVGGIEVAIGAHAGIARYPEDATEPALIVRRADSAYRVAKDTRRVVECYDEQRDHDASGRLVLATQLRRAIERDELTVAYQPKADLRTGAITGVEALVRWEHPERGFVPPDEFVLLAEQTGSIHALTALVFRRALADRRRWAEAGLDLALSVNVSTRDLEHDWLRNEVPGLLAATDCPPSSLTLEITETQLMADVERAAEAIRPLHDLGVRISIDDYGTGYSSLAVLRALPIDEIKIDKSFVLDMRADDNDAVVVRSTVQLGQALGLEVVAEGVETTVSWHLLTEWGCDRGQGYLIARPVPPERIPAIIEAWVPPEADGRPRLGIAS